MIEQDPQLTGAENIFPDLWKVVDLFNELLAPPVEHFEINRTQELILSTIHTTFRCEATMLIHLDPEEGKLIIREVMGGAGNWIHQDTVRLDNSILAECLHSGKIIDIPNVSQTADFNAYIDGLPFLEVHSILCAPLMAHGQILGAVAVINYPQDGLEAVEQRLFRSLVTSLSNAMLSVKLIEDLKVANADLEASRFELLNSRNILRALFDSIPASIYIIDRDYNLVAVNKSRVNRTNQKVNQLVGKKCYLSLHRRTEPCPNCLVDETLTGSVNTSRSSRDWHSDSDQPTEWEISTYPIVNEGSKPVQAIVLEQDVTEKRRLEANLVQSEKLAAVGQLAAGVAHEINNPLSAVIANAQILQRFLPPDDDLRESAKLIEVAGVRASQVVRNLLGFARKEKYDFTSIDLNETIRNALSLVQHEILSHSINLTLDLQDDMPYVPGSRDHLQGVWVNLMVNGIDAIEHQNGEIRISSRFLGNEFRIIVSDNGKGIPPENVQRVFEPFYTTKLPGRGTGLGLSVCHRVIKQHGGSIQVDSEMNIGTKFTVYLPADTRR